MELWEKVLVSPQFLKTDHGQIPCTECHGGNASGTEWKGAHQGLVADPTYPDPSEACGQCHEDISKKIQSSLHYTLYPYKRMLQIRANKDPDIYPKVEAAFKTHCTGCHSTCGACHVSRPDYVEGGFVNGHLFKKHSNMVNQCTACHGSRVGNEYMATLEESDPDIHFEKKRMDCVSCHKADELHGDGMIEHADRYDVTQKYVRCENCHGKVLHDDIEAHVKHRQKLACQVCHSQEYVNCAICHVGRDDKGIPYFKNKKEWHGFKIALNPDPKPARPYRYIVVRRVPATFDIYDYYVKDGMDPVDFYTLPTWKYASPHNIRRTTEHSKNCNNCHGNEDLFLSESDMYPKKNIKANRALIVPKEAIPEKIKGREVEKKEVPKTIPKLSW
ncbi:MAG: hypothetical protein JRI22_11180 [Deltaproteobacteria bacterium]|nr:hypothetical protein [Deltaproteobacteria bacterium]